MNQYRIISDPSWQVQLLTDADGWQTIYYCSSEEGANRLLVKCKQRAERWGLMTDEERMQSILR